MAEVCGHLWVAFWCLPSKASSSGTQPGLFTSKMLGPSLPEHRPAGLLQGLFSKKTFSRPHPPGWVITAHWGETKGHSFFCTFLAGMLRFTEEKVHVVKGGLQGERISELCRLIKDKGEGFPGGAVVKNPPANAGDTGSSPGRGRSHMPRSN